MNEHILTYHEIGREELPRSAEIVFRAFNQAAEQEGYPKTPSVEPVVTRLTEYMDDKGIPGLLYGGYVDGVQVGFFMLRKLGIDEETWEISMLSVDPDHQGHGYGARLLEQALQKVLDLRGVLAVAAVMERSTHVLTMLANHGFACEASGVPVGQDLSIWMLRKDMQNAAVCSPDSCSADGCAGCGGGCGG